MTELNASNSNESSKTSEEDEDSQDDVEPVLAYYRMKNGVLDVLSKDFASCMRVNSKVRIFGQKIQSIYFTTFFKVSCVGYSLGPRSCS